MRVADKPPIMIVVLYLKLGGLERMVIQLIKGLEEDGHKVTLVCIEEAGNLSHQLEGTHADVHVLNKPPGFHINVAWQIAQLARKNKISIVHSHNSAPHLYCAIAKILSAGTLKLIHTKHGRDDPDNKRLVLKNRLASMLSNKVVAVSRDAVDVCQDIESVSPGKLHFVPNGIDMSSFAEIPRQQQKERIQQGNIRLVTVGRLSPEKNQQMMLHALKLIHAKHPQCTLTLCGDGNSRAELEALASQLNIEDRIQFAGIIENIAGELQNHDIFLLSSTTEGMPLAVIEAMAAGLPVVSTNVGGLDELIDQNQNGKLCPPDDIKPFADAISSLIDNPDLLAAYGEAAAEKSCKKFGLMPMVSEYSDLYLEVIS